jgi:chemotaxis methyl-accepting protein methylase
MYLDTLFLRNRPELALIRRLANLRGKGRPVKIAVLGSSNGAEVYSVMWAVRSAQRDCKLIMQAMDISARVVKFAQEGIYSAVASEFVKESIFQRLTEGEMREMFDREEGRFRIKPWIKEGIAWHVGDAGDPRILDVLGPQDIVVANRFLCHMGPQDAERCLRNIAGLVAPGGYLFVSGIDLDVRTKVVSDLGWKPCQDLIEDIHDGDSSLRVDWPCKYWGLEPMNKRRRDWKIRYASVFQLGEANLTPAGPGPPET